ncbi:MAG: hypothetical protein LQ348_007127 [Seirophora lacunosa]|nr:MAG: hypothetical protein LQ348_007127 [Seirophora lacunosa]
MMMMTSQTHPQPLGAAKKRPGQNLKEGDPFYHLYGCQWLLRLLTDALPLPVFRFPGIRKKLAAPPAAASSVLQQPRLNAPALEEEGDHGTKSPLSLLPTELCLLIVQHLPQSGVIALSHTCRRFYNMAPVRVEDLFDRHHSPSETRQRRLDQVEYRKLNCKRYSEGLGDTDAKRKGNRRKGYHCGPCAMEHGRHRFSLAALNGRASRRRCLIHEGLLWICPLKVWTYQDLDPFIHDPRTFTGGGCRCGQHFTTIAAIPIYHSNRPGGDISYNRIVQAFPICAFWSQAHVSRHVVGSLLKDRHLRICPHTSLSDRRIRNDGFSEACTRTFGDASSIPNDCGCQVCRRQRPDPARTCERCSTKWQFRLQRRRDDSTELALWLLVSRVVSQPGMGGHIVPHDWKNLVFAPSEIKRLKEEWKTHKPGRVEGTKDCIATNPFDRPFVW